MRGLRIREGEGREEVQGRGERPGGNLSPSAFEGSVEVFFSNGSIVFSTNCWGYYSKERGCLKLERTEMREFLF